MVLDKRRELIDTLWNVNLRTPSNISVTLQELIDTLWNVNFSVELPSRIHLTN